MAVGTSEIEEETAELLAEARSQLEEAKAQLAEVREENTHLKALLGSMDAS